MKHLLAVFTMKHAVKGSPEPAAIFHIGVATPYRANGGISAVSLWGKGRVRAGTMTR